MTSGDGPGRVHVVTGPGKGKTTAAFGLAMRAAGHGLRVCVIQFMKSGGTTGELLAAERLGNIEVLQFGADGFVRPGSPAEEHVSAAEGALVEARGRMSSGSYHLVVLDEVNVAVSVGLLSADAVLEAVRARSPGTEVVLTGRDAPKAFMDMADYVSVIEKAKHPFDQGIEARKGVEW